MARFEDVIERDGRLVYTNVGDSMRPLIRQDRDILIIEKPHGRLKKYDVPLYKRDSGQYVLHRVLKVRPDDYVICGDNRYNKEYGITDRHIIGVLTAAAATCFWIQNSFYVLDLVTRFKDYAKYPITIFSPVFRFIFTFVMPIAFIAYYPSIVILRPDEIPLLSWLSPLIGVIFFWASYKFWMHGALKYSGTGS